MIQPRRETMSHPIPDQMLACVYESKHKLAVQEWPMPELGPEDVLIRVSHCGVCGTDLHLVIEGWGQPNSIGGHEYSGQVVAVGATVEGFFPGDDVVGGPNPGCGGCEYCREGRASLCIGQGEIGTGNFQGAFAEFKAVHKSQVLKIPEGLGLRDATLVEPLAVALHGITLSGIEPGQRALITGLGPIGSLTLAALRAMGVTEVAVSEPSASRRELAVRLGATLTVEPETLAQPPMPFTVVDDPFHVVFECSGKPAAVMSGLCQLRKAGTLVLLGTGMERHRLDGNRMILNELRVLGSFNYDSDGFERALELLASGVLPTDLLIESDDVPLSGLLEAMDQLVAGRLAGKVLVAPHANSLS
jgi:(R,R)-butanediol dehydrogenase/meso-butanediol dehydrogenase/diacetyl reductase